jgi:hypothetical protein
VEFHYGVQSKKKFHPRTHIGTYLGPATNHCVPQLINFPGARIYIGGRSVVIGDIVRIVKYPSNQFRNIPGFLALKLAEDSEEPLFADDDDVLQPSVSDHRPLSAPPTPVVEDLKHEDRKEHVSGESQPLVSEASDSPPSQSSPSSLADASRSRSIRSTPGRTPGYFLGMSAENIEERELDDYLDDTDYDFLAPDPKSRKEALKCTDKDSWIHAERLELQQLLDKQVFKVVPIPKGTSVLPVKFVYKRKFNSAGQFLKHKVRLTIF